MESWQLLRSCGIMRTLKQHVYRLWKRPFFEHFQPIDFVFSFLQCSLCLQSLETLHSKPPALSLGFDEMQSGSAVIERGVVGHFSQWSSGCCLIWILHMSSQVMALLSREHASPFIPLGGECLRDIFNLSFLHHSSHLSNVLRAEYPEILFVSNACSFLMCGCICV